MIEYNRSSWWKTAFSLSGTAFRQAWRRVLGFVLFSVLVQSAYEAGTDFGWLHVSQIKGLDPTGHAVLGSLLGFLIVFRMNGSNNRYWEGRSHWGQLINSSRNLVRVGAEYTTAGQELADLVSAYVICLRQSLRGIRDLQEVEMFASPEICREVARFGNQPTAFAAEISGWINRQWRADRITAQMVRHLESELARLVDSQGGCEKIQKTPLPFVYVAMIKQLILLYLLTLPFVLFERCGWWSPLLVATISFALFGMEEASVEIEDPFGVDHNCLDLETYTLTITRDVGQLAARTLTRSSWSGDAGLQSMDA
jgi:ion channel-forming bestrophin family protein